MTAIAEVSQEMSVELKNRVDLAVSRFEFSEEGLCFYHQELGKLHLDWQKEYLHFQRHSQKGRQELIAKAVGLSKSTLVRVFDGTLGLSQDAIFLSSLGAQVSGCERNPVVYLLLKDAERRCLEQMGKSLIQVYYGDAQNKMLNSINDYDVIYLDPMFKENKKKSALPRKEMQIFRSLMKDEDDGTELLLTALKCGDKRIVLKRPLKAPDLLPGKVHSFEGHSVRYDLYKGG